MKHRFTDRSSLVEAMAVMREATFLGRDLVFDEPAGVLELTVTRLEAGGGPRGLLGGRKGSWLLTRVSVHNVTACTRSLTGEEEDVYVLDRTEVGRGGQEITLFFRPGDRVLLAVDRIDGTVEDIGKATAPPKSPVVMNPLLKKERESRRTAGR